MKKKEPLEPDPIIVEHFDVLYNEYILLRPWLLKMGIKANRLPERAYLNTQIHRFKLKQLDDTKKILETFKKTVFSDWMRIRSENSEDTWNYHELMEHDNFAEVIALKEASRKCQEFWFRDENNVFLKDKKQRKEENDATREEDTGGVREADQESGT